ncbi:D-alanyl-D-alanine carboxypeptidase [Microbacterium sp.]|uniref:D-alanyl-D-alanine carboxypeptidase n=1 Tax=Microbacterium sp. TaxID=51671 RepID=UPI0039E2FD92
MSTDADELLRSLAGDDADPSGPRPALGWVDVRTVGTHSMPVPAGPDLLAHRPHRSPLRALAWIVSVLALCVAYVGATLLWPAESIALTVSPAEQAPLAAPAAAPAWPAEGSAAVGVAGFEGSLATTTDAASMASITKVVTALLVLDRMPLAVGEQGPSYAFTEADQEDYLTYLYRDESALDVPVDGTLTQYQLLQGMLIGSAGNYADRLVTELWGSTESFVLDAQAWLTGHGIAGITIVDPTGLDPANAAAPAALIALAHEALSNPVIAEIVRTPLVELPGVGAVENTNDLLTDPSIAGIKTGSLDDEFSLLAAKDVAVAGATVRVYAVVLAQPDDSTRDETAAALLDQTAAELAQPASIPAGTVVATVTSPWGRSSQAITDAAADVALWNGATATVTPQVEVVDRTAGATVGELVVAGPLTKASVPVRLTVDIPPPSGWWRLTHPLQVFGLAD